jgi:hypothetical protein
LRLPAKRDEHAIAALLERCGVADHELRAAQLVRAEPRRKLVLCAMALIGATETLVGVGDIELEPEGAGVPVTLVADDELTDGLTGLLRSALVGRASAISRSRAA